MTIGGKCRRTSTPRNSIREIAPLKSKATTDKNPVTPGAIVPTRELLGEMLLQTGDATQALKEFETSLKNEPHRFNGI